MTRPTWFPSLCQVQGGMVGARGGGGGGAVGGSGVGKEDQEGCVGERHRRD